MLRAQAEDSPDGGEFQDPQEVGVALDVFAGVEDQAVTFEEVAGVAKADEGVVGQEPGDAGEPAEERQPREKGQEGCGRQVDEIFSAPINAFVMFKANTEFVSGGQMRDTLVGEIAK